MHENGITPPYNQRKYPIKLIHWNLLVSFAHHHPSTGRWKMGAGKEWGVANDSLSIEKGYHHLHTINNLISLDFSVYFEGCKLLDRHFISVCGREQIHEPAARVMHKKLTNGRYRLRGKYRSRLQNDCHTLQDKQEFLRI